MKNIEIRCGNCGSTIKLGDNASPIGELKDGIHYLVPETVRNENVKATERLNALREAGIDVSKLQTLMQSNADVKEIFDTNDPIIEELSKGGFIRNPELFRRFITAQTFALLKDSRGWTSAVRHRYNTQYVYRMTKRELELQIKLQRKGIKKDRRYTFFTFSDFKEIFKELAKLNQFVNQRDDIIYSISIASDLKDLYNRIERYRWHFSYKRTYIPTRWLNCYKGAGAYYTLQNIIRTHGLVLPKCKDMNESLDFVECMYNKIISYNPNCRRWDILLSVLTSAVKETKFELKY